MAEQKKQQEQKDTKLKKESSIQREAFDFYYGLGERRSLKAVAIHFKRSERTVAGWSRSFNWVDRCTQRALEEKGGKEKDAVVLDVKTRYRRLFNNLIVTAIKDYNKGKLRIKNINDLEKVAKLELALMDSPIDNVVSGEMSLTREDREAVDSLLSTIKAGLSSLRE